MYAVDSASLSLPFPDMTYTSRAGPILEQDLYPSCPISGAYLSLTRISTTAALSSTRVFENYIYWMETIVVGGQYGYCVLRCCSACRLGSVLAIFAARLFQRAC